MPAGGIEHGIVQGGARRGMVAVAQPRFSGESQVEGLLEAECHALGVGSLQLPVAHACTRLGEAVLAVARVEVSHGRPVRS